MSFPVSSQDLEFDTKIMDDFAEFYDSGLRSSQTVTGMVSGQDDGSTNQSSNNLAPATFERLRMVDTSAPNTQETQHSDAQMSDAQPIAKISGVMVYASMLAEEWYTLLAQGLEEDDFRGLTREQQILLQVDASSWRLLQIEGLPILPSVGQTYLARYDLPVWGALRNTLGRHGVPRASIFTSMQNGSRSVSWRLNAPRDRVPLVPQYVQRARPEDTIDLFSGLDNNLQDLSQRGNDEWEENDAEYRPHYAWHSNQQPSSASSSASSDDVVHHATETEPSVLGNRLSSMTGGSSDPVHQHLTSLKPQHEDLRGQQEQSTIRTSPVRRHRSDRLARQQDQSGGQPSRRKRKLSTSDEDYCSSGNDDTTASMNPPPQRRRFARYVSDTLQPLNVHGEVVVPKSERCLTCIRYHRGCGGGAPNRCQICLRGDAKNGTKRTCYWPDPSRGILTYADARRADDLGFRENPRTLSYRSRRQLVSTDITTASTNTWTSSLSSVPPSTPPQSQVGQPSTVASGVITRSSRIDRDAQIPEEAVIEPVSSRLRVRKSRPPAKPRYDDDFFPDQE